MAKRLWMVLLGVLSLVLMGMTHGAVSADFRIGLGNGGAEGAAG